MLRTVPKGIALLLALISPAFAEPRVVPGITEPFMDVTLSSSVQGTIHLEHYKEGSEVKEGQVILELDSKLEELETQRRKQVMERGMSDFESTRTLFEKSKAVSKDELEKKEMEYRVAVAELGIAQEQLRRRKIVAPFTGSIVEILLQPGASCEPYQPLVRLVDTKRCYFLGHLEGSTAAELKLGQTVRIDVTGRKAPIEATISFIAPVVDSASGLARVRAVFENSDNAIRPGLAAKMTFD
jgi:membrane fusion protein (multidrug efflux system)